jgi:hypothetical protein
MISESRQIFDLLKRAGCSVRNERNGFIHISGGCITQNDINNISNVISNFSNTSLRFECRFATGIDYTNLLNVCKNLLINSGSMSNDCLMREMNGVFDGKTIGRLQNVSGKIERVSITGVDFLEGLKLSQFPRSLKSLLIPERIQLDSDIELEELCCIADDKEYMEYLMKHGNKLKYVMPLTTKVFLGSILDDDWMKLFGIFSVLPNLRVVELSESVCFEDIVYDSENEDKFEVFDKFNMYMIPEGIKIWKTVDLYECGDQYIGVPEVDNIEKIKYNVRTTACPDRKYPSVKELVLNIKQNVPTDVVRSIIKCFPYITDLFINSFVKLPDKYIDELHVPKRIRKIVNV